MDKKEFLKKYEELCEEYNMRLNITPIWKPRDDGTWSMVLQVTVQDLPEEEETKKDEDA